MHRRPHRHFEIPPGQSNVHLYLCKKRTTAAIASGRVASLLSSVYGDYSSWLSLFIIPYNCDH